VAAGIAPQALGETTPSLANGYFYANQTLDLAGRQAHYSEMFKAQPWVFIVINKIAKAQARLPLKIWNADSTVDDKSPFAQLMAEPCPWLHRFGFWRWTRITREIYGEAFWLKMRDANKNVIALAPMHPSRVMIRREESGRLTYIFTLGVAAAGLLEADQEDVVPFMEYNAESLMRGMSKMEPLRTTLFNEDSIRRATESFWKRGARPATYLETSKTLSQDAQDRLKANWNVRHAGPDLVGGTAVLEQGLTARFQPLNLEEMQYIESRKFNREEVCAAWDMPPTAVGILDHATFSNITEQLRSVYRDTMTPYLEDDESVMEHYLRPEFGLAGEYVARFDMNGVLRGDFESRATAVTGLVTGGIARPEEGRTMMDLPDSGDPAASKLYANAALVPLGSGGQKPMDTGGNLMPEPLKPKPDDTKPTDDTKPAAPPKQLMRSVLGRLSRCKSQRDMRAKLVDEHAKELRAFFAKQRATVKALDSGEWDEQLAATLKDLGLATSQAIGVSVARSLGGAYDAGELDDWLDDNATMAAKKINAATQAAIEAALGGDDEDDGIETAFGDARADRLAAGRVACVGGLASLAAARQCSAGSKTWVVTSANPRPEHAALDGETVALGENFSNGMDGPGDPSGGADDNAGCTCELDFNKGKALKYSESQERDDHGRFAGGGEDDSSSGQGSSGARADAMSHAQAASIIAQTRENGGATVNPLTGASPTSGFMVSERGGTAVDADEFFGEHGADSVQSFADAHAEAFHDENTYLGTWHDQESGKVFMDVSHNVADRADAVAMAKANDQIAIWDVTNSQEIQTGGSGGLSSSAA